MAGALAGLVLADQGGRGPVRSAAYFRVGRSIDRDPGLGARQGGLELRSPKQWGAGRRARARPNRPTWLSKASGRGPARPLGLDYESLSRREPCACLCVDLRLRRGGTARRAAAGLGRRHRGRLRHDGRPGAAPARAGLSARCRSAASARRLLTLQAVMACLYRRAETGRGYHVGTSILAGLIALGGAQLTRLPDEFQKGTYLSPATQGRPARLGCRAFTWPVAETAAGCKLSCLNPQYWRPAAEALGLGWTLEDPRYAGGAAGLRKRGRRKGADRPHQGGDRPAHRVRLACPSSPRATSLSPRWPAPVSSLPTRKVIASGVLAETRRDAGSGQALRHRAGSDRGGARPCARLTPGHPMRRSWRAAARDRSPGSACWT